MKYCWCCCSIPQQPLALKDELKLTKQPCFQKLRSCAEGVLADVSQICCVRQKKKEAKVIGTTFMEHLKRNIKIWGRFILMLDNVLHSEVLWVFVRVCASH